MLPKIEIVGNVLNNSDEENQYNEKTFYINENTIVGTVDGLEALKQSIYLMLSVESDQYIIYPYNYGITTLDLIGKPIYYVMAVLPSRITEVLLTDERITDVTDFEFEIMKKNSLHVQFVVHTIYGDIEADKVVTY